MARITAYATGGGEPKDLFFAPILAVQNLMKKAGTTIGAYDLIEANEAFAVQALANGRALGWDWDRVNVSGGAIALGHPIGASGARVLTTLLYAMQARDGEDRPGHALPRWRQCRGAQRGARLTAWRPIARAVGWVIVYLAAGLFLTALPFVLYIRYSPAPDTAALTGNSTALLLQGVAQLVVFGFLTWLIGRRVLGLSPAQLGWVSQGQGEGVRPGPARRGGPRRDGC